MKNDSIKQIHIIPFDIGCYFFDPLSLDNTNNLKFTKKFFDELYSLCSSKGIRIINNFKFKENSKKENSLEYFDKSIAEYLMCTIDLTENLKCYILSNGIGFFIFADFDNRVSETFDKDIYSYSPVLAANLQKKTVQSIILLKKKDNKDLFTDEEQLMLFIRQNCYSIVKRNMKKYHIKYAREYSASLDYKSKGLSYILTIYLIPLEKIEQDEIKHLMFSIEFSRIDDKKEWNAINQSLKNEIENSRSSEIMIGNNFICNSWSGVAVEIDNINSYDDIIANSLLSQLLKAELYIQSRWFVADIFMDNVNKGCEIEMDTLCHIASVLELYQSELQCDTSANMSTFYKKIFNSIVDYAQIKQLYSSVVNQIYAQMKVKKAQTEEKVRKNRFIADLFLAVFSASSLYKTVIDLLKGSFSLVNIVIFVLMLLIAVGTIIFNYKNR